MIYIKDKKAINKMRTAGKLLAQIMSEVSEVVKKGVSTLEINDFIETRMLSLGLKPECKGYRGYRHAACISINDVVVHGVPSEDVVLKEGDLVKIDVVASYKNYCADMARSFFVGEVSAEAKRITETAQKALDGAISEAIAGKKVSDLSAAIEREISKEKFGIVRIFAGHGIGKRMHEEPEIPNFKSSESGVTLRPGMTLAIEPMITQNKEEIVIDADGWSARTADGGLTGHVEDTVLVTEGKPEVLTRLDGGEA